MANDTPEDLELTVVPKKSTFGRPYIYGSIDPIAKMEAPDSKNLDIQSKMIPSSENARDEESRSRNQSAGEAVVGLSSSSERLDKKSTGHPTVWSITSAINPGIIRQVQCDRCGQSVAPKTVREISITGKRLEKLREIDPYHPGIAFVCLSGSCDDMNPSGEPYGAKRRGAKK